MANEDKTITTYDMIAERLTNGSMLSALSIVSNYCASRPKLYNIGLEADVLRRDYGNMLDFLAKGTHDPKLQEQYDILADRIWELAEKLYALTDGRREADTEVSVVDLLEQLNGKNGDDALLNLVFEQVADSPKLAKNERKALHQAVLDESLPEYVRCTLLSAILLHLTQHFDARMVEDLYTYTLDDQPVQLQMQAWVTLVFVALLHPQRIEHLPRLREQYHFICESSPDQLFDIQIALLQCREAFTFDRKLHRIINKDEEEEDLSDQERVREFFEFITEGVDTSLSMFSHLKKIAFFSAPGTRHHWLEPFSLEQPHIKAVLEESPKALPWMQMLSQSVAQSSTDKYGAVFSMRAIDKNLMANISEKLEEKGLQFDSMLPPGPLYAMRNYLHDVFRYCNMHPRGEAMRFPLFERNLIMSQNPWLKEGVSTPDQLRKTAEFLFRKERWTEACAAFRTLLDVEVTEESLQKLHYAMVRSDNPDDNCKATQVLVRCNTLFPGNKWTLRHLADLYHEQQEYQLEGQVLNEALEFFPDDHTLLMRLGRCFICQNRLDQAIETLYKADIKKEGQVRTQRELATALFLSGDHERAERFVRMVLSRPEPAASDWMLGGNIAMLMGDIPLAVERFSKIDDAEYVRKGLITDQEHLVQAGIPRHILNLVGDILSRDEQATD